MTTNKDIAIEAEKPPTPSQRLDAIGIEAICEYVANGDSLNSWSKESGFANTTVRDWIEADAERSVNYAHAREERADTVFESLDTVSELAAGSDSSVRVAGLRLKSDNIKWKLARMNAKKYGDKVDLNHGGQSDNPVTLIERVIVSHK